MPYKTTRRAGLDLAGLFRSLGALFGAGAKSDAAFGAALLAMLRSFVAFDHLIVFGYRGDERPIDLANSFSPAEHTVFVALYQEGPYRLDPFYRAARQPRPGFWRMRELAPDRFFSSEYFRSYYEQTRLAEEVGFVVPINEAATVVVSLMRRNESGSFPNREIALLKAAEPLIAPLVAAQWRDLAARFEAAGATRPGRRLVGAASPASVWSDLALTQREAEIVELVLQGHSSESIARRLAIANGTVKVHRRNVYRKLAITSQTQLLATYLARLSRR